VEKTSISYRSGERQTLISAQKVKFHSLLVLWRKLLIRNNIPVHVARKLFVARGPENPPTPSTLSSFYHHFFPDTMCSGIRIKEEYHPTTRINICQARTLCKEWHFDAEYLLVNSFYVFVKRPQNFKCNQMSQGIGHYMYFNTYIYIDILLINNEFRPILDMR